MYQLTVVALAALTLGGCTFVGHVTRFSETPTVPVCVYVESGVKLEDVTNLLASVDVVHLVAAKTTPWVRAQGTADDIIASVPPPDSECRWSIAFAKRSIGEAVIGTLFGFEVLGATDELRGTRSYIYAYKQSLNQLLLSPGHVLQHEVEHLLGCGHFTGCDLNALKTP